MKPAVTEIFLTLERKKDRAWGSLATIFSPHIGERTIKNTDFMVSGLGLLKSKTFRFFEELREKECGDLAADKTVAAQRSEGCHRMRR